MPTRPLLLRPLAHVLAVATLGVVLGLGVASAHAAPAVQEDQPPPESTEAPAPTEAPETTAPTDGTESEDDGDKMSTEDWLILILIGAVVVFLILGVTAITTSHSEKKSAAKQSLDARIREIVGGGRWIHDQASIDILRLHDPDQLRAEWAGVRARVVDVEGQVSVLRAGVTDARLAGALDNLTQALAGLRGAIQSSVAVRLDPPADNADAINEQATQTVLERRRQLDAALQPFTAPLR